jgi:acyl-CoA synthetase (AMP-forming)/AMP-acid ligase II
MQRYALTVDKFLDHAAKWHGTSCVVSAGGGGEADRMTYRQLRERCQLVSGAMLDRGLGLGDRIATLAWNTQDHLTLYYAAMGAGLVCHTLNPRLSVAHLAEMVNEAQDRWIAVGAGLQPLAWQLLASCPNLQTVILLDGEAPQEEFQGRARLWSLADLLRLFGRITPWGEFDEETPAGLCYTSGTIGRPRGVLYTHRSNYLHTLRALQADAVALSAQDSVLVAVPMFHANGWGFPFAAPAAGSKMVLPGRSTEPAHLCALIASERVTVAAAVQTVWLGLVEHLEKTGGELPTLRRIIIGGSHCPEALLQRIEERLDVRVQTSWGMTELSPLGAIEPSNVPPRPGSRTSGRAPMGLDFKLVDADGAALPEQRMHIGRLMVKGPSVAERYFNQPEPAVDAEGWLDTGDLALIDEAGYLTITGRTKDLIKSGGEWINPREIEDVVGSLPEVGLVAVVGCPHPKWGERPVLIVEPRREHALDRETLLAALRGKVPDWWLPEQIVLVAKMPLAATGKIDKKRLRAELAGG